MFLILERWRLAALLARLPRLLRHGYVLLFLLVSWIFFRSPSLTDACHFLGALLGLGLQPAVPPWILQDMNTQVNWALTAADIPHDLEALQEVTIDENGRRLAVRTSSTGTCGKVFQAVGVAMPPTIREL